ncbi:5-bromo-4-chloroindolyl phosphate hydrolysis family protein [Tropicibacter naphthalenivorans]|uniref:5-bromo-4-chloroindolyl phosphate hydrolysis protein n=1 Tax=Tropicibacter naphthalenivorans TaxID=441103 RepID=A0A0P1GBD3_9RHOB|nr:5-bromo-4-chloroindolyl phosphate hydrolysis family protein [Tropicibacter naphthalenivorans]CUH78765.1 5-bromo-4-chloroindolyl phosphate hydrolysis protein [Tropicibacter naphthalenivorans]SMC81442.1 5-bromo-4-chloroindolyl phosphate hydrolysis protein [Tropicibacter naphthalenivorans]
MAQKFGGKYSPDGSGPTSDDRPVAPAYKGAKVAPAGAQSNILFIPPIVLAALSINEGAISMAVGLLGAGALLLGAWLMREGLKAQAAFDARKVARRPALPRKVFAALLTGIGTGLAAWQNEPGLIAPVIFGVAAMALTVGAFGLDPMRDKGMEGIDTFQQDRVARVVDEAETYLNGMQDAVKRAGDRQVEARVERFAEKVREMIRTVEEDPRDLTAAKKFLGVYLMGARDAAVKFSDIYDRKPDRAAKTDFMMLLTDLEESFDKKIDHLLTDNNADLQIEIEVLRDRLQREGVRL